MMPDGTDATHFREDKYHVDIEYFVDGERKTMVVEQWAQQPEDAAQIAASLVPDHAEFDPDENLLVTEGEPETVELTVATDDYDMEATLELDEPDRAIAEAISLKLWFYPEENKVAIRKEQVDQFPDPGLWYTITVQLQELGYDVDWDSNWLPDDAEFVDEEVSDDDS